MVFMNVVDRVGRPILPRDFFMPEPDEEKPVPYLAQIVMPRGNYNFSDKYSKFCFQSLFIKQEVINSISHIKKECDQLVFNNELFNTTMDGTYRIDEFKQ